MDLSIQVPIEHSQYLAVTLDSITAVLNQTAIPNHAQTFALSLDGVSATFSQLKKNAPLYPPFQYAARRMPQIVVTEEEELLLLLM